MIRIVTIADRPDLIPTVAGWLWEEFWRSGGHTLAQTTEAVSASTGSGLPQCMVLLLDDRPVGTASLAAADLKERPDLTPWLAGVFVLPEARGQGLAAHLIAAVEARCAAMAIPTLWLYTASAERIYARAGWRTVETIHRDGKRPAALMRRDLTHHD